MSKRKKWAIAIGAVGALVLLLGGVGIAYAQRPDPGTDDAGLFRGGPFFGGDRTGGSWLHGGFAGGPRHGGAFRGLVEITAEVTGLSEDAVLAALEGGETLAQIAEDAGVDLEEIVSAALADAESRLQEAVNDGRLTQDQMELVLDRLAGELPQRLEQSYQPGGAMTGVFGQFGDHFWTVYDAVADRLGLSPEGLFTELHDGKTLAQIAEEQGVDMEAVQEVVEKARGELRTEAIERAVEEGRMTQEEAEWLLEGLEKGFMPGGRGIRHGGGLRPGRGGHGPGRVW